MPCLFELYHTQRFHRLREHAQALLLEETNPDERVGIAILACIAQARLGDLDGALARLDSLMDALLALERVRDPQLEELGEVIPEMSWPFQWGYELWRAEPAHFEDMREDEVTKNKDFKRRVRQRMAKTGESYVTARRHLLGGEPVPSLSGWCVTGPGDHLEGFELTGYAGGLEPTLKHQGKPCVTLHSTCPDPSDHAVIMQSLNSRSYAGARVRFSAWVRCTPQTQHGELWVLTRGLGLRPANFNRGTFRASPEWCYGEVVIDVDAQASQIIFGLSLTGEGRVWMSSASFDVVEDSVPVTTHGSIPPRVNLSPNTPRNLGFLE